MFFRSETSRAPCWHAYKALVKVWFKMSSFNIAPILNLSSDITNYGATERSYRRAHVACTLSAHVLVVRVLEAVFVR